MERQIIRQEILVQFQKEIENLTPEEANKVVESPTEEEVEEKKTFEEAKKETSDEKVCFPKQRVGCRGPGGSVSIP